MRQNVYLILPVRFGCAVKHLSNIACAAKIFDLLPVKLDCAVKCLSNIACEVCLRGKFVLVLLV